MKKPSQSFLSRNTINITMDIFIVRQGPAIYAFYTSEHHGEKYIQFI